MRNAISRKSRLIQQKNSRAPKKSLIERAGMRKTNKRLRISLRGKAKLLSIKRRRTNLWHRAKDIKKRPSWRTRY